MTKLEKKRVKEIEEMFRNLKENEWVSKEIEEEYQQLRRKHEVDKESVIRKFTIFFSALALILNIISLLFRL